MELCCFLDKTRKQYIVADLIRAVNHFVKFDYLLLKLVVNHLFSCTVHIWITFIKLSLKKAGFVE